MDQLSAHLDRGWDLAQKGDARGAGSSARRAIELCPESPEAHNLLGYVAALEGDSEEAVEAYQQAIFLDESYVEAMLNAAELMVHPMGDFDQAAQMCDQVLTITEYEDEIVDALLLKFEAKLAPGRLDDARKVLSALPAGPFPTAIHNFLAGRAFFEVGAYERASTLIAAAIDEDPHHAEAHYYTGLLRESTGDRRGACEAFLRTRQLELEAELPSWAPNAETFLLFTEQAVRDLSEPLRGLLEGAELYVSDLPGPEAIVDGVGVHALIIVDAVAEDPLEPPAEQDLAIETLEGEEIRLRVFLYAINILRAAGSLHDVPQMVQEALEREIRATVDGFDEDGEPCDCAHCQRMTEAGQRDSSS